jgi:hypothetical protein
MASGPRFPFLSNRSFTMLRDWYRQLIHRKMLGLRVQAAWRRRRAAARGPCFHRLLLEALEARRTPAVHTWIGQGLTPIWSDGNNWSGGVPAGDSSAQLVFANPNWGGGINNFGGLTVARITFNTAGFALQGAPITLKGDTTITGSAGTNVIAFTLDQEPFISGGFAFFDHVFDVPNGGMLRISGQITGHPVLNSVHKTGTGTLVPLPPYPNNNDYGGETLIDAGTFQVDGFAAIPSRSGVTVASNGRLLLTASANIGSLQGPVGAVVTLGGGGAVGLTTGFDNASTTFGGYIASADDSVGHVFKVGSGTWTLNGYGVSTRTFSVNGGSVVDNASIAALSDVNDGSTLAGSGYIGALTVNNGGILNPGAGSFGLRVEGNSTLNAGSHFLAQLNSTSNFSRLRNDGNRLTLSTPTLDVALGFPSAVGDQFSIVYTPLLNGSVTGMFQGLPQNSLFTVGTATFQITYTDTAVILTHVAAPAVAFQVVAPTSATSGTAFDVTVIAVDPYGNTDTNYQGTVTFTTSDTDPGVVLPTDYTFQASDAGMATFAGGATLVTLGDQTITATDTTSGITGTTTVTVAASGSPQVRSPHAGTGRGQFAFLALAPVQAPSSPPVSPAPAHAARATAMVPASRETAQADRFFAETAEKPGRLVLFRWQPDALPDWSAAGLLDRALMSL